MYSSTAPLNRLVALRKNSCMVADHGPSARSCACVSVCGCRVVPKCVSLVRRVIVSTVLPVARFELGEECSYGVLGGP